MIDTEPSYATREDVMAALDFKVTARADARIDRAVAAGSREVDSLCSRAFYPVVDTRKWDWPNSQYARSWRLWLDDSGLIDLTSLTTGGVTIPPGDVILEPNRTGPPYNRVELDISTTAAFIGGDTWQQDIVITGLWGYRNTEGPAGATQGAVDAAATTLVITDAGAVGVGTVLRAGAERLLVTGRRMVTTGQTLQADLTASANNVMVHAVDGDAFQPGEVLLADAERMLIVDIAGDILVVKRAWDGSVLAAHTGATVYAARSLTVLRGALGTTAAPIPDDTVLARWEPPALVRTLAIAEAVTTLSQEPAGYGRVARTSGGGTSSGTGPRPVTSTIDDIRQQCFQAHGRKIRTRAV